MITVSEVIKSSCLKRYPILGGLQGIENEVLKSGIIDYEFAIDGFVDDNHSFEHGDFLISSLLFTQGDEAKLYKMVEKLIQLGVSALGIKNVFFKSIPQNVIDLCDEKGLPIMLFDNNVYFEEIISDIDSLLHLSDWINKNETNIDMLLHRDLSRYEVESISNDMGINKRTYVTVYYLSPKKAISQKNMKRTIKEFVKSSYYDKHHFLLKHKQNYVVFITSEDKDSVKDDKSLSIIIKEIGMDKSDFYVGVSDAHNGLSQLDTSVKEALWSWQVGKVMDNDWRRYSQLGSWGLIIAHQNSKHLMRYMENYLAPIINSSTDASKDLLDTAIAYVLNGGNLKIASKEVNIHDNTFRYRMNKLRDKLDQNKSDYEFFENLSLAIKIYLLKNTRFR